MFPVCSDEMTRDPEPRSSVPSVPRRRSSYVRIDDYTQPIQQIKGEQENSRNRMQNELFGDGAYWERFMEQEERELPGSVQPTRTESKPSPDRSDAALGQGRNQRLARQQLILQWLGARRREQGRLRARGGLYR